MKKLVSKTVCAVCLAVVLITICSEKTSIKGIDIDHVGQTELSEVRVYYDIPLDYGIQDYIRDVCTENDVELETILAIMKTESDFRQSVKSKNNGRSGYSVGILQLNKNHLEWYKDLTGLGDKFDINNAQHNILAGVLVYKHYYDYWENNGYSDEELYVRAIITYNRGVTGTRNYKGDIFINDYVIKVKYNKEEIKCAKVMVTRD